MIFTPNVAGSPVGDFKAKLQAKSTATTSTQASDTDTVMADAPDASSITTVATSATLTPQPSSKRTTPSMNPATPEVAGLHEHDDDIPMMDISPTKEHPSTDLSNPVGATAWQPGPVIDTNTVAQTAEKPVDGSKDQNG